MTPEETAAQPNPLLEFMKWAEKRAHDDAVLFSMMFNLDGGQTWRARHQIQTALAAAYVKATGLNRAALTGGEEPKG